MAIVGPGFSDGTIRTHARKKGFSLVTENQLTEIARASKELGLNLQEIALTFQVPDGLSHRRSFSARLIFAIKKFK